MFRKLSLYEFKCNNALHNSLRSFIETSAGFLQTTIVWFSTVVKSIFVASLVSYVPGSVGLGLVLVFEFKNVRNLTVRLFSTS